MTRSESSFRRDLGTRVRKQHIKGQVLWERQRGRRIPEVPASAIPIEISDHGPTVHFPASIEDMRAVMDRLPSGTLNGLAGIELRAADVDGDHEALDAQDFDGGASLGDYDVVTRHIRVFAYVYDPDRPDRRILETYLRLKMLNTLAHELGHHVDHTSRTYRSWHVSDDEGELRAEAWSETWLRAYVIPYLEETYPADLAELRRWLREHGGIEMPLELLVGRPPTTARLSEQAYLFDSPSAFERLIYDVLVEEDPLEAKVHFAFELHYGLHIELALAVLDDVLAREPDHFAALGWRVHLFEQHLDRPDDAAEIARGLLLREPDDYQSLRVVRDHAERIGDWNTVVANASKLLEAEERKSKPDKFPSLDARIRAWIELGDFAAAQRDLDELDTLASSEWREERVRVLRALWRERASPVRAPD